jgi:hypothetical protein
MAEPIVLAGGAYDITIRQGAPFRRVLSYFEPDGATPIDLTGWEGRSQVRTRPGGELLLTLRVTVGPRDATPADVALDSNDVELYASDAATAAMRRPGWYDVELLSGGVPCPLVAGAVALERQVTLP